MPELESPILETAASPDISPLAAPNQIAAASSGDVASGGSISDGPTSATVQNNDVLSCFLSTFVTIFLAEVGDKTQLATLLMSAQSHNPWTVFAGAATALVATSLVGVLLGRWLSQVLQPRTLERVTGVILAVVSVLLFIDVAGM